MLTRLTSAPKATSRAHLPEIDPIMPNRTVRCSRPRYDTPTTTAAVPRTALPPSCANESASIANVGTSFMTRRRAHLRRVPWMTARAK